MELSRGAQYNMAGYDTLGACLFAGFGYAATPDGVVKRLSDPSLEVRAEAARLLGIMGSPRAVEPLRRTLSQRGIS